MITIIFYHHAKAQRGIRLISLKHSMIIDEKSVHDEANVYRGGGRVNVYTL